MARKRRASIRGRGAEILFGTSDPEDSPSEESRAAPETPPEKPDLEDLFPGDPRHRPASATDDSTAGVATPSESAPARPEESPTEQPPPEEPEEASNGGELYRDWQRTELGMPVDPSPSHVPPQASEQGASGEEASSTGGAGTPSSETAAPSLPGLTPTDAEELAKAVTVIRTLLPDIGTPVDTPGDIPTVPPSEEDLSRARRRVTRAMINELDKEIDALFEHTRREVSSNRRIANRCLRLLHEARQILLVSPGRYADAELKIEEVRVILRQAENSEKSAHSSARWIFLYNVGWFVVLLILLITDQALANWLRTGPLKMTPLFPMGLKASDGTVLSFSMIYYFPPWFCMLWGGIGGVVGSLYSLRWYVARRQYDEEHNLSYLAHPIMGIILGGVVYFLFRTGFFAIQAVQPNVGTFDAAQQILTAQSPVLLLVSMLGGFKQKFVYEMLDRVMRAVLRVNVEGEPDMTRSEQPPNLEGASTETSGASSASAG